ncbi:sensor domain-containing diguanylate cyclase [Fusobacterium sp.]|uniref:sensor domain-containing diguanylate cyclase n=1 Tax=Fusobacterium sp. TaxID=68766 RepID=UPI0025BAF6C0|nr:sensor domain-containing diguanylate cyclase [Fusobacterium sp.]
MKGIIRKNRNFIIVILLALLGNILSFYSFRNKIKEEEIKYFKLNLKNYAKHKVLDTKLIIDDMINDLENIGKLVSEYEEFDTPDMIKMLQFSKELTYYDFIGVTDENGNACDNLGNKVNIADRSYFKKSIKGEVGLSGVISSKVENGKHVQIISYPIYSKNIENKIIGVIYGVFHFKTIEKISNIKLENDENNKTYILDTSGTYINKFQNNDTNINFWQYLKEAKVNDKKIERIKNKFLSKKEGEFRYKKDGVTYYGYYTPLREMKGYLVSESGDSLMKERVTLINELALTDEIVTIICFVTMLICVYFYNKKTTEDIKEAQKKADENIEILCTAAEHSNHMVFTYDNFYKEVTLKTNFLTPLFDKKVIKAVPQSFIDKGIVAKESQESLNDLFLNNYRRKNSEADIKVVVDGVESWYNILLLNTYDNYNRILTTIGIVANITEVKKREKEIKRKLEIYDKLVENSLLYAKVDLNDNQVIEVNGEEIQLDLDRFLQDNILKNVKDEHLLFVLDKISVKNLNKVFLDQKELYEIEFLYKTNDIYKWVSCIIYKINIQDSLKVLFVINDIDSKKHQEIELKNRAEKDGLTGIYNATTLKNKINKILISNRENEIKQVFVLLDLDNYKRLNDTLGHWCGDQVLIEVATMLRSKFRASDIIGRLGGDEFVLLLTNITSYFDAERLIEDLRKSLEKTYTDEQIEVKITASIGVAIAPDDGFTFEELYKKADKALYQAKKMGKNSYFRYRDGN